MEFSTDYKDRQREIVDLFSATFSASEGEAEGAVIADLVRNLFATTPDRDIFVVTAMEDSAIVGAICLTRLAYDRDERTVFILAPVAVATACQRRGIGQALIEYGLQVLREAHADIAVTYGDPGYYAKVGFIPITESFASAPFALKQPEGWQACSLTGAPMTPLKGPSRCVEAFNDPAYW